MDTIIVIEGRTVPKKIEIVDKNVLCIAQVD